MKGSLWLKILLSIVTTGILLFFGFVVMLITAFAGGEKFYTPLVAIVTVGLIILIIFMIFNLLRKKVFKIIFISFFATCLLAFAGYSINSAYRNSIPTVNDQGVDLREYAPFIEGTKAVSLDEPSTLKIQRDLPKLDGATALYPLYSAFVQAVYPKGDYNVYNSNVICTTTPDAYRSLMEGQVDVIFVARPSKDQLAEAKSKGLELKLTPIGYEAFVFFVNSKNKVDGLSTKQIQDIYSGELTNWQDAGGKKEKIRAFQRPDNSGSQTMLQKIMEGKNLMTPPKEDVVAGMGGIIERTSSYRNYKNAIGYSFLFFATEMIHNNQINLLKIDGVYPDKNTIKSKEYPFTAELYAVTTNTKNPNVDSFIEWILSPQGQSLVEKTGYIPVIE
ncbi:MAG: rane protein [Clostridiales bacterium]|nr:rane protein [Clostridiales bacterium]